MAGDDNCSNSLYYKDIITQIFSEINVLHNTTPLTWLYAETANYWSLNDFYHTDIQINCSFAGFLTEKFAANFKASVSDRT